jgi:hypothetical protein
MSGEEEMRWSREGLVLAADGSDAAWTSHAQSPAVLPLSDRLWRIYFSARDARNRARMAAVDVDPGAEMRVLETHLAPMLEPSSPGAFDHEGFGPSDAILVNDQVWLYYTGVSVRTDVRFQYAIGLAVSDDGLRFRRATDGPILSTGPRDPYFSSTPVIRRDGARWRMWYTAGTGWHSVAGALEPTYEIRTASSADGLIWDRASAAAVTAGGPWIALTRPWPVSSRSGMRLWFSRRGFDHRRRDAHHGYRLAWTDVDVGGRSSGRVSEVRFANPPQPGDFDEFAQSYPCVVPYREDQIMFYNGNDFGSGGFGWARLRCGEVPVAPPG